MLWYDYFVNHNIYIYIYYIKIYIQLNDRFYLFIFLKTKTLEVNYICFAQKQDTSVTYNIYISSNYLKLLTIKFKFKIWWIEDNKFNQLKHLKVRRDFSLIIKLFSHETKHCKYIGKKFCPF